MCIPVRCGIITLSYSPRRRHHVGRQERQQAPQLWDSAVKAVKGGSTEQLVETFTSEMTLVAEGLCEDQNNLRKELAQVREMAEKLEQRADNEQEVLDTTLRENQKDIDRRLDELTHRIAALEVKTTRRDKEEPRKKDMGIISQLTVLAGIVAGAWIIVTVLNLFK